MADENENKDEAAGAAGAKEEGSTEKSSESAGGEAEAKEESSGEEKAEGGEQG